MAEKKDKIVIEEVAKFAAKYPGLLMIVANPETDEMFTTYGNKYSFTRFEGEHYIVQRVVSADMFELAVDEFTAGIVDVLKLDEEKFEDINFIKSANGGVKAIGETLLDNQEENGKSKKGRISSKGSKKRVTKKRSKGSTKSNG